MKTKILHYTKEFIFFVILLTLFSNILSFYKSTNLTQPTQLQTTFKLIDSKNYTINKQKPLIIHFWATWCPVCKTEASNIENLSKNYQVLTIAVKSGSNQQIKNYMKKNNLSFKVFNDIDGKFSHLFNIQAFPTTLIYDTNQTLRFSDTGYTSTLGLYIRMFLTHF